jgi:DNA-binding response OmpR family regulator
MTETPRVLIIEDHDVLRAMMFTILRHQPLGVDTAASAEEAIEMVRNCDYALMLVDMDLANGEAEPFLRRFRDEHPDANTFVIAVRDPKKSTLADAGIVSAVVSKPLEIDILADLVRECAAVVPPPDEPKSCPPAENDVRNRFDRSSDLTN